MNPNKIKLYSILVLLITVMISNIVYADQIRPLASSEKRRTSIDLQPFIDGVFSGTSIKLNNLSIEQVLELVERSKAERREVLFRVKTVSDTLIGETGYIASNRVPEEIEERLAAQPAFLQPFIKAGRIMADCEYVNYNYLNDVNQPHVIIVHLFIQGFPPEIGDNAAIKSIIEQLTSPQLGTRCLATLDQYGRVRNSYKYSADKLPGPPKNPESIENRNLILGVMLSNLFPERTEHAELPYHARDMSRQNRQKALIEYEKDRDDLVTDTMRVLIITATWGNAFYDILSSDLCVNPMKEKLERGSQSEKDYAMQFFAALATCPYYHDVLRRHGLSPDGMIEYAKIRVLFPSNPGLGELRMTGPYLELLLRNLAKQYPNIGKAIFKPWQRGEEPDLFPGTEIHVIYSDSIGYRVNKDSGLSFRLGTLPAGDAVCVEIHFADDAVAQIPEMRHADSLLEQI